MCVTKVSFINAVVMVIFLFVFSHMSGSRLLYYQCKITINFQILSSFVKREYESQLNSTGIW